MTKKTKINKRKNKRFDSQKRYKKVKRGRYSKYSSRNCYRHTHKKDLKEIKDEGVLGKAFERLVSKILYEMFPIDRIDKVSKFLKTNPKKEDFLAFMTANAHNNMKIIHTGFKKSQQLIVSNLIRIQSKKNICNEKLKSSRNNKEKHSEIKEKELDLLKYKEQILKHLADSILWQLLGGELHLIRRLYQNVQGAKTLEETNIESVLVIAKKINSNPDNFVLITDITSYVQIGDLIGIVDGNYQIIEVKEGEKNHELLDNMMQIYNSNLSITNLIDKYIKKPKDIQQIQRMMKQAKVVHEELEIMRNDKGHDPVTGGNITIFTPEIPTIYYDHELHELEGQLKARDFWAYTVVDTCIHIGLYKGQWKLTGKRILEIIAKDQKIKNKLIVDARQVMTSIDKPLTFLPFSKKMILDIIAGRVIMYLMLDIDKFMGLYSLFNGECSWTSRKETAKVRDTFKNTNIFSIDNRCIKVKNFHGIEFYLAQGTLCKILFDHIRPKYIAYSSTIYTKDNIASNNSEN